jgi:serine/threonine-protein kinase HipA
MGALEYFPAIRQDFPKSKKLEIDELVNLASLILQNRDSLSSFWENNNHIDQSSVEDILQVGTSAGGARAKAIIAWNSTTGEVRSGQVTQGDGFEYWLMKFDGVSGNRDKELADPQGYTNIEYAYYLMAKAAGISMSECRLLDEGCRHHFLTKRFDRGGNGQKIHLQSLGALGHYDFNLAGSVSYEEALSLTRRLCDSADDVEQLFRRMVFNIITRNQDDHVKNISYLMDRKGKWRLSPAYDMTYSYQKEGRWTGKHQMSMNGKRENYVLDDFKTCGKTAGLPRGKAAKIVDEISEAARRWHRFAEAAGVAEGQMKAILREFCWF